MPARDGGICRLKLPCGQLRAGQAEIVADIAARCGSGVLELTNRANLQLRGIRAEQAEMLIETLLRAGLGPLTPGGDDVRNLLVSPTFGIDAGQIVDIEPIAARVLDVLQTQQRFQQLSPKFSVSIDGGELCAMLEHPHDLWLAAVADNPSLFAFGLAGFPLQTAPLAAVPAQQVPDLVAAVCHTFLDLASAGQARLRDLLATVPAPIFLQALRNRLPCLLPPGGAWQRRSAQRLAHVGVHSQRQPGLFYVGAVPMLGRLDAAQLRALARLAQICGDGTMRFTPWQSVLLPNIAQASTRTVVSELQRLGFATRGDEALARLIACAGARDCAKGRADTKSDARALAMLLPTGVSTVHLTGCERACAAAHPVPFTLLAMTEGRYDIYRRAPASPPRSTAKFGELIARDCTIPQCVALLANASTVTPQ